MFPGMSTPTPEPGTDTAAGPSAADAAAIAKGALTGGAAGAARAALKTEGGRKGLLVAAALPVVAVLAIAGALSGAGNGAASYKSTHTAMSQNVVEKDLGDKVHLDEIQNVSSETGVDWRVLAAIIKVQDGRSADKGAGPYGIDLGKTEGGITEADAEDLTLSSRYVGRAMAAASKGTVSNLHDPSLDVGVIDYTNAEGNTARKISSDAGMKSAQAEVKKEYVAALSTLPIKGNPAIANNVYMVAQNWAMAKNAAGDQCAAGAVKLGGKTTVSLNDSQKNYAQYIINRVAARNMPKKAAVVALATAYQESKFRMYWNPKVPGSEDLAPDSSAEGTDGYSVGLFQQQVHGTAYSWGTVRDAMDPSKSTDMFLDRLAKVAGWESMAVAEAAQKVQVSAFPDAYADWETMATKLVSDLLPTGGGAYSDGDPEPAPSASPSDSPTSSASPTASPSPSPTTAVPVIGANGCTSGIGSGSAGKGDDYPFRAPEGECAWCIGGPDAVDPWTLYKRECVSFTAWRMNVQMGWKEGQEYPFTPAKLGLGRFGNAAEWKGNLAKAGYQTDNTPKVGAIAWWDAWVTTPSTKTLEAGHVGVVAAVNPDGTVVIEEYNFNPWKYGTRTIPAADVTGFIHVADISETSSSESPSPSPTAETDDLHD